MTYRRKYELFGVKTITPTNMGKIAGKTDRVYAVLVPARTRDRAKMINKEQRFRRTQKTCKLHTKNRKERKAPDS
jgi:hypothetical protein